MMHSSIILQLLLTVAFANYSPLSEADKQQILQLHNSARGNVHDASNMRELIWDDQLEYDAQQHANTCPSGHHANHVDHRGEIISWGWPSLSVDEAMQFWVDSKRQYFRYNLPEWCAGAFPNCGQYVQIIWANTSRVGCARRSGCTNMRGVPLPGAAIVCRYLPKGNNLNERPYTRGAKCSACPPGYFFCRNGLCSSVRSNRPLPAKTCSGVNILAADIKGNGEYEQKCVFPFKYNGVLYDECTDLDWDRPWCALEVDFDTRHLINDKWGNCVCVDGHCPTRSKLVVDNRDNGNYNNTCLFPFIYNGVQYSACTDDGFDKKWCSWKTNDVGQSLEWGVCACSQNNA